MGALALAAAAGAGTRRRCYSVAPETTGQQSRGWRHGAGRGMVPKASSVGMHSWGLLMRGRAVASEATRCSVALPGLCRERLMTAIHEGSEGFGFA